MLLDGPCHPDVDFCCEVHTCGAVHSVSALSLSHTAVELPSVPWDVLSGLGLSPRPSVAGAGTHAARRCFLHVFAGGVVWRCVVDRSYSDVVLVGCPDYCVSLGSLPITYTVPS